jgi:hypothetical protein
MENRFTRGKLLAGQEDRIKAIFSENLFQEREDPQWFPEGKPFPRQGKINVRDLLEALFIQNGAVNQDFLHATFF